MYGMGERRGFWLSRKTPSPTTQGGRLAFPGLER